MGRGTTGSKLASGQMRAAGGTAVAEAVPSSVNTLPRGTMTKLPLAGTPSTLTAIEAATGACRTVMVTRACACSAASLVTRSAMLWPASLGACYSHWSRR